MSQRTFCLSCGRKAQKTVEQSDSGQDMVVTFCYNCRFEIIEIKDSGMTRWYSKGIENWKVPEGTLLIASSEEL